MFFKKQDKCLQQNPNFENDEACLDITNLLNETVSVWTQYKECHRCSFQNVATLPPNKNTSVLFNTDYSVELYYQLESNKSHVCPVSKLFSEHYRYGWNITNNCDPVYIKNPSENAFLPILSAFIILCSFGTIWYMIKCIYKHSARLRRLITWNNEVEEDLGSLSSSTPVIIERAPKARKHPHRIKSIDVFRGFCITVMVFVEYGGGQYYFFKHSVWNGLTIADLVFPWFMWLMGFSLNISLENRLRRAVPRRTLVFQIIRRSLILIFLGIIVNSNHNYDTIGELRFPGVLQRFGITYLIVGLLEVAFKRREDTEHISHFHDILIAIPQWVFVISLVIIHTCITFLLNVPGCGTGYLGPGGLDDGGKYSNCTGGAAGYIDRLAFGEHMYKTPRCHKLYETTVYYDPEGILGTLTAILMVYFGVQAGRILNTYRSVRGKVSRWLIWGLTTCCLAAVLCEGHKNDGWIPINKQLWSLSFVLLLSGMAFLVQTFLFLMVDISRKWGGRPLFYPGMNSIVVYVGCELLKNTFPFCWKPTSQTHAAYLLMNLWGTFLWVAISIYMYKHDYFLSL